MEARELRIGNWVQILGVQTQVEGVSTWDNFIQNSNFAERELIEFQAISITKEWLLNFGFVQVQDSLYKKHEFFYNLDLNHFLIEKSGYVIEFVHQLQNLYFALTEEELQFKTLG